MPSQEGQRLLFNQFRDETFPPIRPLSQLPNRVSFDELYESSLKNKKGTCRLAPPDTAVIAEIRACSMTSPETKSVACLLRNRPIAICIRNTLLSDCKLQYIVGPTHFPRSRIAIKSGLFRSFKPSFDTVMEAIYVACPEAIEILGLAEEDESKVEKSSGDRASQLFSLGDAAVCSQESTLASLWYSAAADAAAASSDNKMLARSLVHQAHRAYNLGRFDKTIAGCNKALRAHQDFPDAICLKALGLYGEQNNRDALCELQRALELAPGDPQVHQVITVVGKLAYQQETGNYDVTGFFLGGCKAENSSGWNEWADFSSDAIEIRMTGDGRGRGVFLTREVRAGELLMVSNPLVAAWDSLEDLQVKIIWRWSSSSRVRRILKALRDDQLAPDIRELAPFSGESDRWGEDAGEAMDVREIKKLAEMASRLSFKMNVGRKQVFGLPAFINHSCLPNSSMVAIGGALFIRAAASIPAGEEITVSYIDCLQPLGIRSKMIRKAWDFTCSCRRCKVETRFKKQLQNVPELHSSSLEALVKRVKKLESVLTNLSDEEREWIQIGFLQDHLRLRRNLDQEECQGIEKKLKLLSGIEVMKLLRRFAPGHGKGIALIAGIVREYVLKLEWDENFDVDFDDAISAMIGKITLPSEDYITLCDHLQSDEIVSSLFGAASGVES